jgi:hypothetical protein
VKIMKKQDETALAEHPVIATTVLKPRNSDQLFVTKRGEETSYVNRTYSELDLNKIEQQQQTHPPATTAAAQNQYQQHQRSFSSGQSVEKTMRRFGVGSGGSYDSSLDLSHIKHSITSTTLLGNGNVDSAAGLTSRAGYMNKLHNGDASEFKRSEEPTDATKQFY